MAIYSASVKTVSRGGGRSATAAAAYRNGEEITDERTGEVHDYRRRTGVEYVASFAPEGMTPQPSAELWNRAEAAEARKNARVAREVLVALPAELAPEQRRELALGIAQALANRYGTAGTLAVHTPDREGDQRNHHAHILMTTRRLELSGALGEKTRELDDVKRGPQEIEWIRTMIEARTNHALERAGSVERVDRRSLVEQRDAALEAGDQERAAELDRLPTIHEGPRVTQIRRECEREQRAPLAPVTRLQVNNDRRQLAADRAELGSVSAQIIDIEQARATLAAKPTLSQLIERIRRETEGVRLQDLQRPAPMKPEPTQQEMLVAGRGVEAPQKALGASQAFKRPEDRVGAVKLRQGALQAHPEPLEMVLRRDPAVLSAGEQVRKLAAIGSGAHNDQERAAKEIEQWRTAHTIRAWAHDAGLRSEYLGKRERVIERAERIKQRTLPDFEHAKAELARVTAEARARIELEQRAGHERADAQERAGRGLFRDLDEPDFDM